MKHSLRLYDDYGSALNLVLLELLVDEEPIDFDTTEQRIHAIEEFRCDSKKLGLCLELTASCESQADEAAEVLIECPRTRYRQAFRMESSGGMNTWLIDDLHLPASMISGKITLSPRLVREQSGNYIEVARGHPVEIIVEDSPPPGGQGFVQTKYASFESLDAVSAPFKKHLIFVDLGSAVVGPTVYINSDYEGTDVFEAPQGRSNRARLGTFCQNWARLLVATHIAEAAIFLARPHLSDDSTDEDLAAMPESTWVFRVLRGLSNVMYNSGILDQPDSDNEAVVKAVRYLTRSAATHSIIGPIATKMWPSGDRIGDSLEHMWRIVRS